MHGQKRQTPVLTQNSSQILVFSLGMDMTTVSWALLPPPGTELGRAQHPAQSQLQQLAP